MWKVCRWLDSFEYFQLWDIIQDFLLTTTKDSHSWRFESSGIFTSKSAYQAFFNGLITFEPWRHIWKSWAPVNCKVFHWFAVRNRCWTADRLAKWNLSHPSLCPLCGKPEETMQHLLTSCVFACKLWFRILSPVGFKCACQITEIKSLQASGEKQLSGYPKKRRKVSTLWSSWVCGCSGNIGMLVYLKEPCSAPLMMSTIFGVLQGLEAWCFRSGSGDNLAVVDRLCVLGQVLPCVCVLLI